MDNNQNEKVEVIKVEYSPLTKRMMDRDEEKAKKKMAKSKAADTQQAQTNDKKPKWRKVVGWVAGGAAAVGAVFYGVMKLISSHAEDSGEAETEATEADETEVSSEAIE